MAAVTRPVKHGSYGGYLRHQRRGEEACADCKRANAVHSQQYREQVPAALDKQAVYQKRRNLAIQELIRRHPDEYREILASIDRVVVKRRPKRNAA
jgi:hypothetical protein